MIAYDASFIPRTNLWKSKSNKNVPIIRLVSKDTLEHAFVYHMITHGSINDGGHNSRIRNVNNINSINSTRSIGNGKKTFSDLPLSEIKKIINFGLDMRDQSLVFGCEISQFDVDGICEKVIDWARGGFHEELNFGMEDTAEAIFGKKSGGDLPPPSCQVPRISEKRAYEGYEDAGAPKRRKVIVSPFVIFAIIIIVVVVSPILIFFTYPPKKG